MGSPYIAMQFPFVKLPALRVLSLDGMALGVLLPVQDTRSQNYGLGKNRGGPKCLRGSSGRKSLGKGEALET